MFTGVGIYFALIFFLMSCNFCLKDEFKLIDDCFTGFSILIHVAANAVFIWQYFFMSDLLKTISNNPDSCGIDNQDIISQSQTYYDHFVSFPLKYILGVFIIEIVSMCFVGYFKSKINNNDARDNSSLHAQASRRPLIGHGSSYRAPAGGHAINVNYAIRGRAQIDREQQQQQAAALFGMVVFTAYGFEFVKY